MANSNVKNMVPIDYQRERLAALHHVRANTASPVMQYRRRHRPVSSQVVADTFRPVPIRRQASVALMGTRGLISIGVAGFPGEGAGASVQRPIRGQPQARLATQRDRKQIDGATTPGGHPAVGRSVLSPLLTHFTGR